MQAFRLWWRLLYESIVFGAQALRANPLRTLLSLLGVTIGIFAIIAVLTMVDSLDRSIKNSFKFINDKVVYVQKWPWSFGPDYPWWKYLNRPVANYEEYKFVERNATKVSAVAMFASRRNRVVKYNSSSVEGVTVQGITYAYTIIDELKFADGRYFTQDEMEAARNVCIIGNTVKDGLFNGLDPIGKEIKIKGIKYVVIGVLKRQGENLLGVPSADNIVYLPFRQFSRLYDISRRGSEPTLAIKGLPDDKENANAEGELRGLMRNKRGLKPFQEDNFAINRPEMLANFISQLSAVLSIAGAIIGSFSILVGGFGIANIMFVSVKERTNLIGIQKSLGAKNMFILVQFLFESVFLSVIGGVLGLILVSFLTGLSSEKFQIVLSFKNISLGLAISAAIGIVSGLAPAILASRLDPVEAIRSK